MPAPTVTTAELAEDASARLWRLVDYLAEDPARATGELRPFWLVWVYDAEVLNGGHLQYFHNQGPACVPETIVALEQMRAVAYAQLLKSAWSQVEVKPVERVRSLGDYPKLALARSFKQEDDAYYSQPSQLLDLLERHYEDMLRRVVAEV